MEKLFKLLILLLLSSLLSACGSHSVVQQQLDTSYFLQQDNKLLKIGEIKAETNRIPEHFIIALKGYLKQELSQRELLYKEEQNINCNCIINIDITYYRMRSDFTRMMFGVMAGKDGVDSKGCLPA